MSQIAESLKRLFDSHRIIFWHDEKAELLDSFQELVLPGVECIQVNNNEFYIKHRVVKQVPEGKFLIYRSGPRLAFINNWLLDLELAHYEFHTNQEATFLQELGLEYDFKDLVSEHIEFFKSKDRRQKLKGLLGKGDAHKDIRYKMLGVVFNTPTISLPAFIQAHASAFSDGTDRLDREFARYNLEAFYWQLIADTYKYSNGSPKIYDFLLGVFSNVFSLTPSSGLTRDANLLLSLWKDSIAYQEAFQNLSDRIAVALNVQALLDDASLEDILDDDLFRIVDYKIIHELISLVESESISNDRATQVIKSRENKYWYKDFRDFYSAIAHAIEVISLTRKHASITFSGIEDVAKLYSQTLFQVDFHYRKFIWHYRNKNQDKALELLFEKVEKVYSNDWLLPLNNRWQALIDAREEWPYVPLLSQSRFYKDHVEPVLNKGQRVFVIVSDALRYECGYEYLQKINAENRYEGELHYLLTGLPSYTQLGMASLLPHQSLSIIAGTDKVSVDGVPCQGVQGRQKVLATLENRKATAIQAEDFMKMNSSSEGRDFVKQYELIYIFHNQIDKTGDDKTTEDKVFEAVDRELNFLLDVVKRVANMNGTYMLVTTDHGFLYQHTDLDESDFTSLKVEGDVWKENRRFIIGNNLAGSAKVKKFSAQALNLSGNFDVLLPKSVSRHRVMGAGSRFVHGGASVQEVVIPLIKITKKRQDTTKQVGIDVIQQTNKITTNILSISFLQTELITDSILPRSIKAGLYAGSELISDQFTFRFDIQEGSERQREVKHRFQLSSKASGKYKNQSVKLVLEEPVEGSSMWRPYKEYTYTLNISFSSDFDDF
ncbi:BREX-1 system phosphatase PglZ type A [Hymenobacter sp. BT491]|uniref:BREX-1 system phosphatase PglZ type A n=1 Tax=Hymenobacter sp. BT491 TaxID=2766779 RepID=UPI001653EA2F|nr:BREX-1 system phosphatase PglZ type A [Hymenobacter sp. BT491]MBC6992227.1 BREX-1 system phosphatase PglZ type A [Hymenobacter sp. BT491]